MKRNRTVKSKLYLLLALFVVINLATTSLPCNAQEFNWTAPPVFNDSSETPVQDPALRVASLHAGANGSLSTTTGNLSAGNLTASSHTPANAIRDFIQPKPDTATDGDSQSSADWVSNASRQLQKINWQNMLLSLGIVITGYVAFVFSMRWISPHRGGVLPTEVIEVLGTAPLSSRQTLQLVRLGSKLLLLINSPEGTHTIGEIANPNEVEHLAQLCCARRGRRAATAFRKFAESNPRDGTSSGQLESIIQSLQLALNRAQKRAEYEA